MTNATLTPEIALLREDVVPRLTKNMRTLFDLSTATTSDPKNALRLAYKAVAIQKVIREQGERLQNVKTEYDVAIIVEMIRISANYADADKDGTQLAIDHILDYLR